MEPNTILDGIISGIAVELAQLVIEEVKEKRNNHNKTKNKTEKFKDI